MGAYKLNIGDGEHYLKWDGESLFVKGLLSLDALSVINANIGKITAGEIHGVRFYVGNETDQDIFFEDSEIRLYDVGTNNLVFYKAGLGSLEISMGANAVWLGNVEGCRLGLYNDNKITLNTVGNVWLLYPTGTLQLPILAAGAGAGPAGLKGMIAFRDYGDKCRLMIHDGIEWRYITNTSSDW